MSGNRLKMKLKEFRRSAASFTAIDRNYLTPFFTSQSGEEEDLASFYLFLSWPIILVDDHLCTLLIAINSMKIKWASDTEYGADLSPWSLLVRHRYNQHTSETFTSSQSLGYLLHYVGLEKIP
ncbi:conserved hypothetical protein [Ricinus communis]|uniref:Uncharacterized protein n=1 Tax=Ricinus communis TaxID=3988 RepID=B9SME5_RICCO|nr:conserved hypothetical protein [Ricinus communis]